VNEPVVQFLKSRNGDFWLSVAMMAILMLVACYALRVFALPSTVSRKM